MKKKQTYIIGDDKVKTTPKKKIQIDIQAPKPKKKPSQKKLREKAENIRRSRKMSRRKIYS